MLRWGLKSNTSGSSDGERLPRKHLEYQPVKLRFINNVEKTRNQGRFVGKVPRENFLYGSSIEVSVCQVISRLFIHNAVIVYGYARFLSSQNRGRCIFTSGSWSAATLLRGFSRSFRDHSAIGRTFDSSSREMLSMRYCTFLCTYSRQTYRINKRQKL